MVPSHDFAITLPFFQEVLGFNISMQTEGYAVVIKDGLTIHFLNAGADIGQMEFYLEVEKSVGGYLQNLRTNPRSTRGGCASSSLYICRFRGFVLFVSTEKFELIGTYTLFLVVKLIFR
jgi:hypothetical protein